MSTVPDDIVLKLEALASSVFPTFLLAAGSPAQVRLEHSLDIQLLNAATRSTLADPFIEALLADPQLAEAFEFRGGDSNARRRIIYALTVIRPRYLTTGNTLSGQIAMLPGKLILTAAYQCLADEDLTQQRFVAEAKRALTQFRSLIAGHSVTVLFYAGLNGIKLAANIELSTPWGTVRHLRSAEDHLFALGPPEVRVILQGTVEVQVAPGHGGEVIAGDLGAPALEEVDLMARKTALALAFAVDRDPPAGVATSWSIIIPPVVGGTMMAPGFRSGLVAEHELSAPEVAEFQRIASLVEERYCHQIDLAVRRCLSALGKRSDPVDSLVDAMISLESLTQQDISGVTFQLAASVAVLLGRTAAEREATFRQMKKLYGMRSKLVHGSGSVPHLTVAKSALDTVNLALQGLHALFFDRPELLTSDQRGRDIVLGTAL